MARTFFTQMILQRKTASSRPVLATSPAKKEMVQAGRTVIIPNVVGMRFCASPLLTADIETETSSATIAEFKEMRVQSRTANLTVMELHPLCVRGLRLEVGGYILSMCQQADASYLTPDTSHLTPHSCFLGRSPEPCVVQGANFVT